VALKKAWYSGGRTVGGPVAVELLLVLLVKLPTAELQPACRLVVVRLVDGPELGESHALKRVGLDRERRELVALGAWGGQGGGATPPLDGVGAVRPSEGGLEGEDGGRG